MNLFKTRNTETSDDYYEAYKTQLDTQSEKRRIFSFANILKAEIATIALGFFIMQENHLQTAPIMMNASLPVSIQNNNDQELIVRFKENPTVAKLDIREDNIEEVLNSELVQDDVYTQSSEIDQLINSLKLEMAKELDEDTPNRVILSQM